MAKVLQDLAVDRRIIVLTHDERLREHLLARPVPCEIRGVERNPHDGVVTVVTREQMWRTLLDDASQVLTLAKPVPGATLSATDIVRGLCRQAVDNAIREFVVGNAVVNGGDVAAGLARLDAARVATTWDRLVVAQTLYVPRPGQDDPVARAMDHCRSFRQIWNAAAHGNPTTREASRSEVRAAYRACRALLELDR